MNRLPGTNDATFLQAETESKPKVQSAPTLSTAVGSRSVLSNRQDLEGSEVDEVRPAERDLLALERQRQAPVAKRDDLVGHDVVAGFDDVCVRPNVNRQSVPQCRLRFFAACSSASKGPVMSPRRTALVSECHFELSMLSGTFEIMTFAISGSSSMSW